MANNGNLIELLYIDFGKQMVAEGSRINGATLCTELKKKCSCIKRELLSINLILHCSLNLLNVTNKLITLPFM